MPNCFSLFSKKTALANEHTALLEEHNHHTISINKKKKSFTQIYDGHIDDLILQYFAKNLNDYLEFGLISTFHKSIAKPYIPLPPRMIKNLLMSQDGWIMLNRGIKTAKLNCPISEKKKKIESFREIDQLTLNKLQKSVDQLDFKLRCHGHFFGAYGAIVTVIFIALSLLTYLYLTYFYVDLFKSKNDLFSCYLLDPNMSGDIDLWAMNEAKKWLYRNPNTFNNTDQITLFCHGARQKYCKNRFNAIALEKSLFDAHYNVNVMCWGISNSNVIAIFSLLALCALLITGRIGYLSKQCNRFPEDYDKGKPISP